MKNRTGIMVVISILIIVVSSQIPAERSMPLAVVQQLLLGIGLIGCLLGMWEFIRSGKKKNG